MARNNKQLREARVEMMLFYVLAELFPKMSDTQILDISTQVKDAIKAYVWLNGKGF